MATQIDSTELALPMAAQQLLPHRPPMLFVRSLTGRFGDSATGVAMLPDDGMSQGDAIFPEFCIEVIAQTIAMANGYDALCAGEAMKDGMLVGIDSFSFVRQALAGSELTVNVEKTFQFGAVHIISGEVLEGEHLLAKGTIKVWEDLG